MNLQHTQWLLSLPASAAAQFRRAEQNRYKDVFAASDPPAKQLGSGGGTAYILEQAWRHTGENGISFSSWLNISRKLLIHGSGESRRLPAYAAQGKPMMPIPIMRGISSQNPDQALLDLQMQTYNRLILNAPSQYRVMVSCGDVFLRFNQCLPEYPQADVLIFGLTAPPEEAEHHGVLICIPDSACSLSFFLQKPSADHIMELKKTHSYYLDTGVWLLSERALSVLMRKCDWRDTDQTFKDGVPSNYDLYAAFGPALGIKPSVSDHEINNLRCAVIPIPNAHFYHFGTNRSVIASVGQLQNPSMDQRSFGHASMESHVPPIIQNSEVKCDINDKHRHIWIENSYITSGWKLTERHVLTGIPDNDWALCLPPSTCIDFTPVANIEGNEYAKGLCVRFYGFDDPFRGACDNGNTFFLNRPLTEWCQARGLTLAEVGISQNIDIHCAPLFPVLELKDITCRFLTWLFADEPEQADDLRLLWLSSARLSAAQLLQKADIQDIMTQRLKLMATSFAGMQKNLWLDNCSKLDLASAAEIYSKENWALPEVHEGKKAIDELASVHDSMFRAAVDRLRGKSNTEYETEAFDHLRSLIINQMEVDPALPERNVLEDQIVWCRAPVRLDLAGGWSDTPPYCLEHGGRVVNAAVNLNGQPPIQVFARIHEEPDIVIRSIDLGTEDRVCAYKDLHNVGQLGSGFGIARAALALSGFDPRFHAKGGYKSLEHQLKKDFGGGIELCMLAAVPKGSGLGTSSILAATLFAAIGEISGLHWDATDLFTRTLALEQMLTAGGGWQDQVGGITGGLKFIETDPGITQKTVIRWLPGNFFSDRYVNTQVLLYYTGITRIAHDILGEIVRGLFLNSNSHLSIINEISLNALYATDAIQRNDWNGLCEAIRRSWNLNQQLDSGTNPPAVQSILDKIGDYVTASKLLGAGGGGYMLIFAKDQEAALKIRETLTAQPPNNRARFVDIDLSDEGLQITRS